MTRGVKTESQVLKIKKACKLGDKIYSQILKEVKVGISERELRLKIERAIRKNNASLSFRPIVAFGENASEPHHVATSLKLRKNHGFLKLDLGTKVEGYCSDMTRTVFMGKASGKQKRIYQIVLEAQQKGIDYITGWHSELDSESRAKTRSRNKFGMTGKDVDKIARDYIVSKGYPTIPHTLGHGIGKKVHEGFRLGPKSRTILRNGMVFTIEPGIYIKGFGGVRIEDVFYLKAGKLEQLTHSPKDLIEL